MIEMILILIAAHYIADYPLQGDAIAVGKNRNVNKAHHGVPWFHWLTAHACTHAMAVGLMTGNVWLGLAEFIAHFIIDFGKCEKWFGLEVDQILHVLCKILWVFIVFL